MMRKGKVFKTCMALLLSLTLCVPGGAYTGTMQTVEAEETTGTTSDGLSYTIDTENGNVTITDYTGEATEIVIPAEIDGYAVTSIESSAFSGCSSVTSIAIPNSVTRIGFFAFYECSSLTSITIPDGVRSIGYDAFYGCSSLMSIEVDSANTAYSSLDGVLYNKEQTELVAYPEGKTGEVVIQNGVTSIGEYAFAGCSGLTDVTIPEGVTSIEYSAFYGCSGLTSIVIPAGVTSIGNNAFSGCSSLTSIVIPDSVTRIGWFAFSDCSSVTSIAIPDSLTSIGDYAFSGCSSLMSIEVDSANTAYSSLDGVLYNKEQTELVACPEGKTGEVVIQNGVTSIEEGAFDGCSGLTGIVIPDGVTSIGIDAFQGCSSLTNIAIPDSVTIIQDFAFV